MIYNQLHSSYTRRCRATQRHATSLHVTSSSGHKRSARLHAPCSSVLHRWTTKNSVLEVSVQRAADGTYSNTVILGKLLRNSNMRQVACLCLLLALAVSVNAGNNNIACLAG